MLRKEASRLGDAEKSFFQQKAKLNFNLQSDRGSKFYHSFVKGRQGRNFIAGLTLEDGTSTTSSSQVVDEFLGQEVIDQGPKLTVEQGIDLLAPIGDEEIRRAIFGVGKDKSPGSDGFTSAFFKRALSVVGELVTEAIR